MARTYAENEICEVVACHCTVRTKRLVITLFAMLDEIVWLSSSVCPANV